MRLSHSLPSKDRKRKNVNSISTEVFDMMQNYYRSVHNPLIRCMLQFPGRLDENVLLRAINLSIPAVRQIACQFCSKTYDWEENTFSAKDMLHIVSQTDSDTVAQLLLSAIAFEKEPQLKLFLVRGEKGDTLCVIFSHLVADGAGFKQYLYLLAELYSKCAENPAYNTAAKAGDRSLNQLLHGYSFRERAAVFTSKSEPLHQDDSMFPPLEGEKDRLFVVRCVLHAEQLGAIKAFGKNNHATVNDMLMTAFARALSAWTGSKKIAFPCFVDMRKYLKDQAACGICNMTSSYSCHAEFEEGETFAQTLKNISGQMAEQKKSFACLKGPALLNVVYHVLPRSAFIRLFPRIFSVAAVSLTNMGILDENRLTFGNMKAEDAFLSTAVKYAPYFQVSISTWCGSCSLCSSFHGTPKDERQVRDFLKAMKKELLTVSGL